MTVGGIGGVHRASPQYVSGDYFRALGVGAALGRVLIPADDKPGAPAVVVLTYGYWQRQFGADPSVCERRNEDSRTAAIKWMPSDGD